MTDDELRTRLPSGRTVPNLNAGDTIVSRICVYCGQSIVSESDLVAAKLAELEQACAVQGISITFDRYISEGDAASLLGRSKHTLRNRRYLDQPLPFRKLGRSPEYSLIDLARFIVGGPDLGD